jgi:hypothetical protein
MTAELTLAAHMVSRRLNELAAVVLAVYLSAIIGGGLHHHDSDDFAASKTCPAGEHLSTGHFPLGALTHDDSDDCSICAASNQAKTPPVVILLAGAYLVIGKCVVLPRVFTHASVCLVTLARAPPVI